MKFTTAFVAIVAAAGLVAAEQAPQPRGHEAKAAFRHSRRDVSKRGGGKLTWYAGGMLSNPACGGSSPSDDDMVVAVAQNSGYGTCNQKVKLNYKGMVTGEASVKLPENSAILYYNINAFGTKLKDSLALFSV